MIKKKLQVGDKIRIISKDYVESLPMKGEELHFCFIPPMKVFCGKIAMIESINSSGFVKSYRLDIDDNYYCWSASMFEEIVNIGMLRNE